MTPCATKPTSSGKYVHNSTDTATTRERNSMLSLGITLNKTATTKCSVRNKDVYYRNPRINPANQKQPSYLLQDSQKYAHTLEFELRPHGPFLKHWYLDKEANQYKLITRFKFYDNEPSKLKVLLPYTFLQADVDISCRVNY